MCDRDEEQSQSSEVDTKTLPVPGLSARTKFTYGVGHVLNDLCATMWFTYLLVFLQKVARFTHFDAGILLMIGQVADAIATPIVGIESDRIGSSKYGKRKIWHLGGSIAVALSFPFIFNLCVFRCAASPEWSLFFYYAPFIVIFQFGWASTQISHLALIPDLASEKKDKVTLNALRYGFTVGSNTFVYVACWLLFEVDSSPGNLSRADAGKFRILVLIVIGVGILFVLIFHIGVKESSVSRNGCYRRIINEESDSLISNTSSCRIRIKSRWTSWFQEIQFYQIGGLYMATRLVVNLSQVYIPMYVTDTLKLDKKTIAIVPLIVYVSGIIATAYAKPFSNWFGLKLTYFTGVCCVIGACAWFWFLDGDDEYKSSIYGTAVLLGFGSSTLLIAALAMTSELIGDNNQTGAFVYGAMSFLDKLSNGIAVLIIQRAYPCTASLVCCPKCESFYRAVMSLVPGGAAVLGLLFLITLSRTKIGVLVDNVVVAENGTYSSQYGSLHDGVCPTAECTTDEDSDYEKKEDKLTGSLHSIQSR